mmetsp:Transcript_135567/g.321263  ORF Transcript_135567/g.321263 Transcript_135567/m.321263 type:complete len:218 (+) Transcript_135567:2664-3317(+)
MAILQTHQQSLSLGSTPHHLDVADQRIQVPFSFQHALEGIQLKLPLLAENDVVRGHNQQGANKLLLDLLNILVVHIQWVVVRDLINKNLVGQLHRQAISVHCDLLHVVLTSDPDLLLCDEMLDNDVRHHVAVSVAVLVQAMHSRKDHLIHHYAAVVAANHDVVLPGANRARPDPVVALPEVTQVDALPAPELNLFVAAAEDKVITAGEEVDAARVEL